MFTSIAFCFVLFLWKKTKRQALEENIMAVKSLRKPESVKIMKGVATLHTRGEGNITLSPYFKRQDPRSKLGMYYHSPML
jgi:hypothetical protein